MDYILLHSTAHFLQASAHFLQLLCAESFSHSAAQALQMSSQSLQSASQNDEPLAQNLAHKAQMSAQSRQSAIHFKWFLSFMFMQLVAHFSHSMAHARQASMHFLEFSILFLFLLFFFSSAVARSSGSLLPDISNKHSIFSLSRSFHTLGISRVSRISPQDAWSRYIFYHLPFRLYFSFFELFMIF